MAGGFFVWLFVWCSTKKTDNVIRVWTLHDVRGAWGGLAFGIFGTAAVGGLGNVSFIAQLIGTIVGVAIAVSGGLIVYGLTAASLGLDYLKKSSMGRIYRFTTSRQIQKVEPGQALFNQCLLALPSENTRDLANRTISNQSQRQGFKLYFFLLHEIQMKFC